MVKLRFRIWLELFENSTQTNESISKNLTDKARKRENARRENVHEAHSQDSLRAFVNDNETKDHNEWTVPVGNLTYDECFRVRLVIFFILKEKDDRPEVIVATLVNF